MSDNDFSITSSDSDKSSSDGDEFFMSRMVKMRKRKAVLAASSSDSSPKKRAKLDKIPPKHENKPNDLLSDDSYLSDGLPPIFDAYKPKRKPPRAAKKRKIVKSYSDDEIVIMGTLIYIDYERHTYKSS